MTAARNDELHHQARLSEVREVVAMPWGWKRNLALASWLTADGSVWNTHLVNQSGNIQATTRDVDAAARALALLEEAFPRRENSVVERDDGYHLWSIVPGAAPTGVNRAARRRAGIRNRKIRRVWGGA